MKTLELHEIEFETDILGMKNNNYPHSGFYLATIKKETHLVLVDKKIDDAMWIAPKSVFSSIIDIKTETNKEIKEYSQDFILEFARILLNRK